MSINGERIGRRLMKRHGLVFDCDPCNFLVRSDREGVELNVRGGRGVMQWLLKVDCRWFRALPKVMVEGVGWKEAEIGTCFGASTVLKWKHWHVYLDRKMSGGGMPTAIIWIDKSDTDKTEWE